MGYALTFSPTDIERSTAMTAYMQLDPNTSLEVTGKDSAGGDPVVFTVSADDTGLATGTFTLHDGWGVGITFTWPPDGGPEDHAVS